MAPPTQQSDPIARRSWAPFKASNAGKETFNMNSLSRDLPDVGSKSPHAESSTQRGRLSLSRISEDHEEGEDDEEQPETTYQRARRSISGMNDVPAVTQKLAFAIDRSYHELATHINTMQEGYNESFQQLEDDMSRIPEQITQAVTKAVNTAMNATITKSVNEAMTAFLAQQKPRTPPPPPLETTYVPPHRRGSQPDHEEDEELESESRRRQMRAGLNQRHNQPTPPPGKAEMLRGDPPTVIPVRKDEFKPQEIGYFHPGLVVTKEQPEGPYVIAGKDTIYRDVHMFVQQAKRVGRTKNVAAGLHLCLRGSAMTWFSCLEESRQDAMCDSLFFFCQTMVDKYKQSHSQAFDKLHAEHYTMADAKRLRPADEYIQNMIRYGQSCDQSTAAVLTLAWKNLDQELQRDIRRPKTGSDPDEFARDIDDAAEYWASSSSDYGAPVQQATAQQTATQYERWESNPQEREAAFQRGVRATERRLLPPSTQTQPRGQSNRYTQDQANRQFGYRNGGNGEMQPKRVDPTYYQGGRPWPASAGLKPPPPPTQSGQKQLTNTPAYHVAPEDQLPANETEAEAIERCQNEEEARGFFIGDYM